MDDGETASDRSVAVDHEGAADAFVSRVTTRFEDVLDAVFVFGSTARGDAAGLGSDVDVLVVVDDDADRHSIDEQLQEVAYDVMLAYGPVVELHVVPRGEFEELRERGNPFVRNVVTEGRSYG